MHASSEKVALRVGRGYSSRETNEWVRLYPIDYRYRPSHQRFRKYQWIELELEPDSLDLVRIEDLDGDGRADIRITRPMPMDDPDVTAPARLELYLSGGRP